jgi:hypothetical protein
MIAARFRFERQRRNPSARRARKAVSEPSGTLGTVF